MKGGGKWGKQGKGKQSTTGVQPTGRHMENKCSLSRQKGQKQVTKEDTKGTLARQNKQYRIVEQNKARTTRNRSKTKEVQLDCTYVKKGK
jgi:hypothetical protein